jgi:glutaredoxin
MFDLLTFQHVPGADKRKRILMLALSTCGFCRRGQDFLENHALDYQYVHLDVLDAEVKAATKSEFKERFGVPLSYPALIIDDDVHTVGYVKRQWEELLGLPHEEEQV